MKLAGGLLLINLFFSVSSVAFSDVDFEHSSGLDLMKQYSAKYAEPNADVKIKLLKDNYERLKPSKITSSLNPIIPKIIHLIWLGKAALPQNYKYYMETWRYYHPSWEIKLWTEQDILKENFVNMDLYWLARSYQERSDIIRYEILRKYGGLYIDTDIECFANFDDLHHKYDFYTNYEPPAINKKRVSILNAMVASVPNHPILTDTLNNIRKNWKNIEEMFDEKYSSSKSSFARSNHHLAVERTMYPFIDAVFAFLSGPDAEKHRAMILPSGYNVPVYFVNDVPILNLLSRLFRDKAKLSNQIKKQPETMSIHFHDKENSLLHEDYFGNSLFNHSEIKGVSYMLFHLRDKYYLAFRKLFQLNFPTLLSYNVETTIPNIIYLENEGNLSAKEFDELKNEWQKLNEKMIIKIFRAEEYKTDMPNMFQNFSKEAQKIIARFYLINNSGGVYVSSNFIPANLTEFHYKYSFYGQFKKLNKLNDKLQLDLNIIAASQSHSIIRNFILNLEEKSEKVKQIDVDTICKTYLEYAYRYYELDGKSIIFPEVFFNQKR